ncbi:MAG: M67 family metallopeptidase [Actinobacteria bacterium]|nr:M67 family metallopeptidase [Actinomycetota bacterium]
MKLTIPKNIYEQMIDHCRAGLPNEACGFLAGRAGAVERFIPLENAAASPVYYRPDDKQMIAAMREIDDGDLELSAIFHSHVASAPRPSVTDIREAHYPDSVYLIVSLVDLSNPEARGWLIQKEDWRDESGQVEEVELVLS